MTIRRQVIALALTLAMGQIILPNTSDTWAQSYQGNVRYTRELRAANEMLQGGRYEQAESIYTRTLKKNPRNLAARSGLAVAQAGLYKLGAAEKNARQVLERDPNNAYAYIALGMVHRNRTASHDMYYKLNRDSLFRQSAAELEQAVRLDPKNPEAYNELGVTYRFQGRYDEARQMFEKALALDPNYAEALLNAGIASMAQGKVAEAKQNYRRAITLNSKNHMAHFRLAEALGQEGQYHEALESLNTALALDPGNASVMSKMAEMYDRQGNQAAAVANYRKAIQKNPGFMPAYIGLSNLFDKRGDGEAAMTELRSALNANPGYSPARNQLGRLALSVNKPLQAANYYRESLRRNPNDVEAINGLSQALTVLAQQSVTSAQALGQDSELVSAEATIEEALRLNPNDLRLHLASIRIGRLTGRPKASWEELERIISRPARSESEEMLRGEAYLALGRYAEADQVFDRLIAHNSRNTGKLLTMADTLRINGDLEKAEDAYHAVLLADPGNVKARRGLQRVELANASAQKSLRLAESLNNFIQKESAVDFYEESLAKNPKQPEARLALSKLYEKLDFYAKAARSYQFYLGLMPDLSEKKRERYEEKVTKLQGKALEVSSN